MLKDGRYEILELTSNKGGFGWIYRARDHKMHNYKRFVAIKEYHVSEFDYTEWSRMHTQSIIDMEMFDADMRNKFTKEALVLKKLYYELEDKHIPQVGDTTWTENGRTFYAMSFIDGATLRESMDGVMAEQTAVEYIIQTAKVLHKAHGLGLVHADVSPNNIMLKKHPKNYSVLVDWGNAMSYNDGYGIGTYGFRAPEAFWGTPQTDIYSLAATLLYLLTGRVPDFLDSELKIKKTRELLAKRCVSMETTEAIIHAMNIDTEKATKSIHEFVMELPKDLVIKSLLNYKDNDW